VCENASPRFTPDHWDECELDEQERRGIPRDVRAGDEVRCKVCGRWHLVGPSRGLTARDQKPDEAAMRYIPCGDGEYFVGREGLPYRVDWERRRRAPP
jgi:hypothetical protein